MPTTAAEKNNWTVFKIADNWVQFSENQNRIDFLQTSNNKLNNCNKKQPALNLELSITV